MENDPILHASLSPFNRRLWKVSIAWTLFVATLIVGNCLLPAAPDRRVTRHNIGEDFLVFYSAGTLVRTGHSDQLYDIPTLSRLETATAHAYGMEGTHLVGPWWNPPFAVWLFVPFSALTFPHALAMWLLCGAAALTLSLILLIRTLPPRTHWRQWALIPLLCCVSAPFWGVLGHGQNTAISLLLLTITILLWRNDRPLLAGLVLGLLFYKPQVAIVVGAALTLHRGWRAAAGLCLTGLALLILTCLTMPATIPDYLHRLPANLHRMQEVLPYVWDRHVTLKAFWRLLFQGTLPGAMHSTPTLLWLASEVAVGGSLLWLCFSRRHDGQRTDAVIAATIAAMPLLMPFYFDYDLLLLLIPAVLTVGDVLRHGPDRRLTVGWCVLYVVLLFSTNLAIASHINLAVPAMTIVASLLIRRALRAQGTGVVTPAAIDRPLPLAA